MDTILSRSEGQYLYTIGKCKLNLKLKVDDLIKKHCWDEIDFSTHTFKVELLMTPLTVL